MAKIILGVLAATVVLIVVFLTIDPKFDANAIAQSTLVSEDNTFKVTVEGEVYKTGTYTLQEGALMSDLFEACGGPTESADELAYFVDAELNNGSTYFIASKYDTNNVCTLTELTKVNINQDDADTLASISGITSSIANSIVSTRNEKGEFDFPMLPSLRDWVLLVNN